MKVAITSTGDSLESKMDARFGRCAYFAIYDSATQKTEFAQNPNKEASGGAGPASAQLVASKEVNLVISGDFGGKVKDLFNQLNISMLMQDDDTKTIAEIIKTVHV